MINYTPKELAFLNRLVKEQYTNPWKINGKWIWDIWRICYLIVAIAIGGVCLLTYKDMPYVWFFSLFIMSSVLVVLLLVDFCFPFREKAKKEQAEAWQREEDREHRLILGNSAQELLELQSSEYCEQLTPEDFNNMMQNFIYCFIEENNDLILTIPNEYDTLSFALIQKYKVKNQADLDKIQEERTKKILNSGTEVATLYAKLSTFLDNLTRGKLPSKDYLNV